MLPGVPEQVEKSLQNAGVLHREVLSDFKELLLPLLSVHGVILRPCRRFRLSLYLFRVGSRLLLRLKFIAFQFSLVSNSALRIVERFSHRVKASFLGSISFSFLSHGLLTFGDLGGFLFDVGKCLLVKSIVRLFVLAVVVHGGHLSGDVGLQVFALCLLPTVSIFLDGAQGEQLLLLREFAVLAHRVEARNELNLAGLERLALDRFPFLLVGLESLAISFGLSLKLGLRLLVLGAVFILLAADLLNLDHVCNTSIVSFLEEAGLVLKLDSHVGTESGHLEEMNLGFANDLTDADKLWHFLIGFKLKLRNNVALIIEFLFGLGLFTLSQGLLLLKYFICNALVRLENLINEELVLGVGVAEVDVVGGGLVQMSFVVVVFLDCFEWLHHFADVHGSCLRAHLQVVVQQLQLVRQVLACVQLVVELADLLLPVLLLLSEGCLLSSFLSTLFGVGLFSRLNDGLGLERGNRLASVGLGLVQKPLGQEVNWVLGVGLV